MKMGNLKYLLMLALAATTVFTSCSKDGDNDNDPNADPREAIVGSYNATSTVRQYVYNGTGYDTTVIASDVDYVFTISIPPASDSLPSDFVLVRNITNGEANQDVEASLTNDVLVFDPNETTTSEVRGTVTISGSSFTGTVIYNGAGDHRTAASITATKRN